jgi:hypothetical protein
MKTQSRHYKPAPPVQPDEGEIRYMICADAQCIAVYRVRARLKMTGYTTPANPWRPRVHAVYTAVYEAAPDAEHPDIYKPGFEDSYLMHGLYILESEETEEGGGDV